VTTLVLALLLAVMPSADAGSLLESIPGVDAGSPVEPRQSVAERADPARAAGDPASSRTIKSKTVTLDVKDEDVVVILKSMQQQCGIRNLLIDKDVQGKGLVYFRDVPCETAFRTVFHQFGLTGQVEPNLVHVETRPD
jgi:hypothetical protein